MSSHQVHAFYTVTLIQRLTLTLPGLQLYCLIASCELLFCITQLIECSNLYLFFLLKNDMSSKAQNRSSNIHYSSVCIIRFKSCSLIVDNTLSSMSVPQAPLG